MITRLILFSTAFGLIIFLFSCKGQGTGQGDPEATMRKSGDTVYLSSGSDIWNKLVIKETDTINYTSHYTTTGVVRPLPGHLAEISSPFDGRVVSSYVRLGEKIAQGAPVFGISASDYFEVLKTYRQSAKEKEIAEKNHKRKQELYDQGIIPVKELDESSLELEIAEKEYSMDEAVMKVFNTDPEKSDFTHPLIIRSPIAGEVVQNNITIGQYLNTSSQPGIIVANLEKIWVVAHVKEKDLGTISPKDKVEIIAESQPNTPIQGVVDYIGGIMEDQTRSVEVYIECTNIDHLMKPGMYVTVSFDHTITNAILIPSSAVLQEEDYSFLFEQVSPLAFVMKKLSVVSVDNRNMLVSSGIRKGEKIVTEGGIYLR
jgi:membrane fusion protein, heavy metal efflux system